jgi:glycosyltransferase involved in cell wall biosynthesis
MQIVLTTPSLNPEIGGPSVTVLNIYNKLKENKVHVNCVTKLSEKIPLHSFRVIHNFGIWTPFNNLVSFYARKKNIPEIICPMGMLEPWALSQKKLKKKIAWSLYQKYNLDLTMAIQCTGFLEAENIRSLGIKSRIAIIPHGINFIDNIKKQAKHKDESHLRILFLSRIHPKKGLIELVDACAQLKSTHWTVTIAGPDNDNYMNVIQKKINTLGLKDHFNFLGPVYGEQKNNLFINSDLFVLPTYSENFGLVVGEALSAGLPVITTDATPWQEINDFKCGWVIPTGTESLLVTLNNVINIPKSELRAMGKRGQSYIRKNYDWNFIVNKHIALYQWILYGGKKPDFLFD